MIPVGAGEAVRAVVAVVCLVLASCREPTRKEGREEPTATKPVEPVRDREPSPAEPPRPFAGTPPAGWVDIAALVPGIVLDIRYAGANNFTGGPLPGYAVAAAWLREDAARALARVQSDLAAQGHGLLVHDAYRPTRATAAMVRWAEASGRRDLLDYGWIARRSLHAMGDAIDLTLVDLDSGEPVDMGSEYDALVPPSRVRGVSGEPLAHRLLLRGAMERRGFAPYDTEWWHFTYRREVRGPALDIPYGD